MNPGDLQTVKKTQIRGLPGGMPVNSEATLKGYAPAQSPLVVSSPEKAAQDHDQNAGLEGRKPKTVLGSFTAKAGHFVQSEKTIQNAGSTAHARTAQASQDMATQAVSAVLHDSQTQK